MPTPRHHTHPGLPAGRPDTNLTPHNNNNTGQPEHQNISDFRISDFRISNDFRFPDFNLFPGCQDLTSHITHTHSKHKLRSSELASSQPDEQLQVEVVHVEVEVQVD